MNRDPRIEAVRQAIENPGPFPEHHRRTMARQRADWPTLWKALDALLAEPERRSG